MEHFNQDRIPGGRIENWLEGDDAYLRGSGRAA
jgi:hypothetical protein